MAKIVRLFSRHSRGQRGFTLIELLVVVAILSVLAIIVIPNVARFIGSGTVQAANTEQHDVLLAVHAYMADNSLSLLTATTGYDVGPGADLAAVTGGTGTTPKSFMANPGQLQATYTFGANATITNAVPEMGGKWQNLSWVGGNWQ